jgi:hypothetical protein
VKKFIKQLFFAYQFAIKVVLFVSAELSTRSEIFVVFEINKLEVCQIEHCSQFPRLPNLFLFSFGRLPKSEKKYLFTHESNILTKLWVGLFCIP